jgi:hypothetical protein
VALDVLALEYLWLNEVGEIYGESHTMGMGSIIDIQFNIINLSRPDDSFQLVVQESNDNITYTDSIMSKVYTSSDVNSGGNLMGEQLIFRKKKSYHRFKLVVMGAEPSQAIIELYQY